MTLQAIVESSWMDWAIKVLVVAGTVTGVTVGIQQRTLSERQKAEANCVAHWADDYTRVAEDRTGATQARLDTLHQLLLDAVNKAPKQTIDTDIARFVQTERNYQYSIRTHPLPDPPELRCP